MRCPVGAQLATGRVDGDKRHRPETEQASWERGKSHGGRWTKRRLPLRFHAIRPSSDSTWKTLLLVYNRIAVSYVGGDGRRTRFENALTDEEIRDGLEGYERFPTLAADLTNGAACVETTVVHASRPLGTLTPLREHQFWPSPDDTRNEFAAANAWGTFHSLFVYWPQNDFRTATSVPSGGWGLGMGASDWTARATYATVANAPGWAWRRPMVGEVWLHEWLHGASAHFAARGHRMPERDADGGGLHGYVQSPVSGWTDYYRDLMTARVSENGEYLGIPADAWQSSFA